MFKKMFVAVLMCMFLTAGASFATGVPCCSDTDIDNHSINGSFNKNTYVDKSINVKGNKTGVFDNNVGGIGNKVGINDNNVQIGKGNVNGDQTIINKGKGNVINGDNNSIEYNDKRAMNQGQAQAQGQKQGQGQSQSANNEGVSQDVTVEGDDIEADKRDLVQGPVLSFPVATLGNGKESSILTKGSIFSKTKTLTKVQVSKLLNGASNNTFMGPDAKVVVRKLDENDYVTDKVTYGVPTGPKVRYIGTVYVVSEGADLIALEALASDEAMKLGCTHLFASETDTFVQQTGSAKGISIGASGSGFAKGDDIAVAPGAMLGWSKVKASNEALGSLMFDVYTDDSLIIPPKK